MITLKFVFFDPKKNDLKWWNRLFDRLPPLEKREWVVVRGGANLQETEATFEIGIKMNATKPAQEIVNEVVWCFFFDQINVDKFFVNGNDVTKDFVHR